MLVLYHADTAVCAAKVRVVLAEKQLQWEGRLINLHKGEQFDPAYMKLNPNAVVPTLVHDGTVLTESSVINEYLDDTFSEHPLMPANPLGRALVHGWTKREDTIHDVINTMTTSIVFRTNLLRKPPEERAARYESMPDPAKRAKWRELLDNGLRSKVVADALVKFGRHWRDMEQTLESRSWLAGDQFTLADAGLISFFYRMEMMHAELWKDPFPRVAGWFERCKARPSFAKAIGNYVTPETKVNFDAASIPLKPEVNAAFGKAMTIIGR